MCSAAGDAAIRIVDMRVDYGEYVAVHGLSLEIPKGEVFGLIGPNGAGKTSSFKVLATLMRPTYGDVFLDGVDVAVHPESVRDTLGYMPDMAGVPSDLKSWEFLELFASAYGFSRNGSARARVDECLQMVGLEEKRNAYCRELSRGMKQRLVFAKTIMHEPAIMILDEPASGMDPVSRAALRKAVRQLASRGTTVVVSSHILTELSDMCTSVGIMDQGRLVASGSINEVVERLGSQRKSIRIKMLRSAGIQDPTLKSLHESAFVADLRKAEDSSILFSFSGSEENQCELLKHLVQDGAPVTAMEEAKSNIEDVVVSLGQGGNGDGTSGLLGEGTAQGYRSADREEKAAQ